MRRSGVRLSEAAPGRTTSQRRRSTMALPASSGPSSARATVGPQAAVPRPTGCLVTGKPQTPVHRESMPTEMAQLRPAFGSNP
jgi:hypothetical protein